MMKESTFQLIDIFERHFNTKKCGHQETGGHSYNAGSATIMRICKFNYIETMWEDF